MLAGDSYPARFRARAHDPCGLDGDLEAGRGRSAHAIELGADLAAYQPQDDDGVFYDPDGHAFCLYAKEAT